MHDDWRTHPGYGLDLEILELFLKRAWCEATASPGCREGWTEENPAYGQCAVTTALLWRMFRQEHGIDVEILRSEVEGFGSHYWIRLSDGTEVDMTRSQFPKGTVIPPGEPRTIKYLLDSERAVSARTRERMELLDAVAEELFANWLFNNLSESDANEKVETAPETVSKLLDRLETEVEKTETQMSSDPLSRFGEPPDGE